MRKTRRSEPWIITVAFFVPLVILCIVYAMNGIAPFGDQTMLISDADGQYIQFWTHLCGIIRGDRDAFYTFSKTLGGSMAGLYAYYLASPLNIIFVFFPEEQMPLAMNLLILLKLSLCGLAFAVFAQKTRRMGWKTLLFSTAYALCSYNIGYCWSLMWLDGVILLPIIALGLHYISEGKKPWIYILSLGVAIISSYYIGFMLCIFSLFYYIYLTALKNKTIKTISKKSFITFAISSLSAGAISAAVLLPGILSMRGGKRAPMQKSFERSLYYYIDLIASRVFPEKNVDYDKIIGIAVPVIAVMAAVCLAAALYIIFTKKISLKVKKRIGIIFLILAGLILLTKDSFMFTLVKTLTGTTTINQIRDGFPNIFTGMFVLFMGIAYFVCSKIERKEKIASAVLVSVLMLSFSFEMINTIWHGFTKNNMFNFRYSFIFSFVLLLLAMKAVENFEAVDLKKITMCVSVIVAIVVFGAVSEVEFFGTVQIIFCIAAVIIFAVGMYMLYHRKINKRMAIAVIAVLSLLHAFDLCYNTDSAIKSMITRYDTSIAEYELEYKQISDDIASISSDDFFRIRKDYKINNNDPMTIGYNGLSHFSSTDQTDVVEFMGDVGSKIYSNIWASAESDFTRAADALLGVKYFVASEEYLDYDLLYNDGNIYENPYALPIGFIADDSALGIVSPSDCTFEYQNNIFDALDNGKDIFLPLDIEWIISEGEIVSSADTEVCYEFTVDTVNDAPVYMHITNSETWLDNVAIYVNDEFVYKYGDAYDNSVILCGNFETGEEVRIKITAQQNLFDAECIRVYYESSEALQEYHEKLTSQQCLTECETDSHIITRTTVTQDNACLVYTIPYEEDWKVTVDGEKIDPSKALDIFMAIPLEQGEHIIEMRYVPSGLSLGVMISLLAITAVGSAMFYDRKKHIFN